MKVRIARIAKRMHNKFRGLYWRQMSVTVGMVRADAGAAGRVLLLPELYLCPRARRTDELLVQRSGGRASCPCGYLETGRYLSMEELQKDEQFRQLAATAATDLRDGYSWSAMTMATCCSPRTILMAGLIRHHPTARHGRKFLTTAHGPGRSRRGSDSTGASSSLPASPW